MHRYNKSKRKKGKILKRVLIYGAGDAGTILAKESLTNGNFPYEIVGFIDDNFKKVGTEIYGVKVLGTMAAIKKINFS